MYGITSTEVGTETERKWFSSNLYVHFTFVFDLFVNTYPRTEGPSVNCTFYRIVWRYSFDRSISVYLLFFRLLWSIGLLRYTPLSTLTSPGECVVGVVYGIPGLFSVSSRIRFNVLVIFIIQQQDSMIQTSFSDTPLSVDFVTFNDVTTIETPNWIQDATVLLLKIKSCGTVSVYIV